ncbi:MAG: dockerin type I domain-containing protein, partial [Candidatus Omnitrophota bacterium]
IKSMYSTQDEISVFMGGQAKDAAELLETNIDQASHNVDVLLGIEDSLAGVQSDVATLKALVQALTSSEAMSGSAASAAARMFVAEEALKGYKRALSTAKDICATRPQESSLRDAMGAIEAQRDEVEELSFNAKDQFDSLWTRTVTLPEGSLDVVKTINYTTSGEMLTLSYNDGNGLVTLNMRNRDLTSVTIGADTIVCDLHNTKFGYTSDGVSVWRVKKADGSIIQINDLYTGALPTGQGTDQASWIDKIIDRVDAVDFGVLDSVVDEGMRGFKASIMVMDTVMNFFKDVVEAYTLSLQSTFSLAGDSAEAKKVAFYMPFVRMLQDVNPDVLLAGGLGPVSAWLVGQGVKIMNCASAVLTNYLMGSGVTTRKESLAAGMIISDILSGLISSGTTGEVETSLYSIKAIARAKGANLNAIKIDMDDIATGDLPAVALTEVDYRRHVVSITAITSDTVTYVSDGKTITASKDDFANIYKGYILTGRALTSADTVVDEVKLLDLSGSRTPADVLRGLGDLTGYIEAKVVEIKDLRKSIKLSLTSAQAKLQLNVALSIYQEVASDADYIATEWGLHPTNMTLKLYAERAAIAKVNAKNLYEQALDIYNNIIDLTEVAKSYRDLAMSRYELIAAADATITNDKTQAPALLAIATQALDMLNATQAKVNKLAALYPKNVEFAEAADMIAGYIAQSLPLVARIKEAARQAVDARAVSKNEFARADVTGDGQVNDADIAAMQEGLAKVTDITGDKKVTAADMAAWESLLEILANAYLMNPNVFAKADINKDGSVTNADSKALADAIAYNVDLNNDGVVNAADLLEIKKIMENSTPTFGKEYTRTEYMYNAERGDNRADAYAEASRVVRDASYATENARTAAAFAQMARYLADKAESEKRIIVATPSDPDDIVLEYNKLLAEKAAERAEQMAIEAETRAAELAETNPLEKVSVLVNALIDSLSSEIGKAIVDGDTDKQGKLEDVLAEIQALMTQEIFNGATATFNELIVEYNNQYASQIIASEEVLTEIITYIQKGEDADTSKALYEVFGQNEAMLPILRGNQDKIDTLMTSVNELYLKITDIKDYYVNEVVFDAAARLAKEGYDNAKAAADAEFESACAIIKADAANVMAQAQAAFNALAAKIATITADTTSAELDAIFTEALNRRAPLASSRNRLLMYLQTA